MPKKQSNEITYFFVTQDSRTKRGGRVSRVTNKAKYQGMALARVGDIVTYDDRSEATINDDPAYTLPPNVARDGGNIHA